MLNRFKDALESVRNTGTLDADARQDIQRIVYDDGKVTLLEADTLFAVNDAITVSNCPEWPAVFIGAITDLLVRQSFPANHIDAAESVWLIQRISHNGVVQTNTELELLLNILRHAESAPDQLEKFALDQVKAHVLSNGFVTAEDVEHLRSILYACGSLGGVGITRMEAEALFDISDATAGVINDETFTDLFVGAVANHLMMSAAPAKLTYDERARREYWLHQRGDIASGWTRLLKRPLRTLLAGNSDEQPPSWLHAVDLRTAETITAGEARWLTDRLLRDDAVSSPEKALLAFLAEDAPRIHESLTHVMAKTA